MLPLIESSSGCNALVTRPLLYEHSCEIAEAYTVEVLSLGGSQPLPQGPYAREWEGGPSLIGVDV